MSKLIENCDELRDWKNYRKVLKLQIDGFAGSGSVFVTKEKFEFDYNGRPFRSRAVLLGEKGRRSAQLLRKQGVPFKEGTAELRGDALVLAGVGGKAAREAIATFRKLALGIEVSSAEPLDDEEEDDEATPKPTRAASAPGGAAAKAVAAPGGAPAQATSAPGGAPKKSSEEGVRVKHNDVFLLTMAIGHLRTLALGGPDGFSPPRSGKRKVDELGALMYAIVVDAKYEGRRAASWKKVSKAARNLFAAVGRRAASPELEELFDAQVAEANRDIDAIHPALLRADTVAEANRIIQAAEKERAEEAADERAEKIEERGRKLREDYGVDRVAGPSPADGLYLDARVEPELAGLIAQTDALTRKELGRMPSSVEDKLIWLDNLERVKKVARAAIAKAAHVVRAKVDEVHSHWETYVQINHSSKVARAAETLGGAVFMRGRDFARGVAIAQHAMELAKANKIRSAADALGSAIDAHQSLLLQWQEFDADTTRGAGRAIVTLEVVKEASFTIVSTYAGGAAASALKVGAIGTVTVTAAVNVAGSVVMSGVEYAGHVFAGTTDEFDVTEAFFNAVKTGAASVAGGGVSKFAKAKLASKLTTPLSKALESKLGAGTGKFAGKILDRLVYDMPEALMEKIVEDTIDTARGKSFGSTDEFLDSLTEKFARGAAADLFTSALTGKNPKSTDAIVEALAEGISG